MSRRSHRSAVVATCSLYALIGLFHPTLGRAELQVPTAYVDQFAPPDPHVLEMAQKALEAYRDTRPFKSEWEITRDATKGLIETNWFPEHKGEVRLKVQVAVWGTNYHVDVWHKVGFLFHRATKTDGSRHFERLIQEAIAEEMAGAKGP